MAEFDDQKKFKPTFDEPKTDHAQEFEKDFTSKLRADNIRLEEVDSLLAEKEQSLKKKIFDLAKMEALVHGDQQLSAVYNEMAEDGGEKYGYHYNETIMNLIFNEYVMNSPKFLQKYKMAVPKEKKRRDKSGIHKLQQAGQVDQKKQQMQQQEGMEHNNSLPGAIEELNDETSGNFAITNGMGFNIERDGINRTEKSFDTMKEPIVKEHHAETREEMIDAILTLTYDDSRDTAIYSKNQLDALPDDKVKEIYHSVEHQKLGVEPPVDETTGAASSGAFAPALSMQKRTVGEGEEEEEIIDETTTSASSGQYTGPFHKKKKKDKIDTPFWDGGEMIQESNYITDSSAFKKFLNEMEVNDRGLNQQMDEKEMKGEDPCWDDYEMVGHKMKNGKEVPNCVPKNESALRTPGLKEPGLKEFEMSDTSVPTMAEAPEDSFTKLLMNQDPAMIGNVFNDLLDTIQKNPLGSQEAKPKFEMVKNVIELMPDAKRQQLPQNVQDAFNNKSIWQKIKSFFGINESGDGMALNTMGVDTNTDDEGRPTGADSVLQNDRETLHQMSKDLKRDGVDLDLDEKAESKSQQRFMGMVRAAQKGEMDNPSGAVAKAAKEMKPDDVEDFASTKHDGLPEKVEEQGLDYPDGSHVDDDPYAGQQPDITYDDIKQYKSNPDFNNMEKAYANLLQYHWRDPNRDVEMLNKTLAYLRDSLSRISGLSDEQIQNFYETQNSSKGAETRPDNFGESMIDQNNIADREANTMAMKTDGSSVSSMGGADMGGSNMFEGEIKEDVSTRTACKKDEEPVAGIPINQPGGCKKKVSQQDSEDAKKNPHNLKSRRKRIAKKEKELEGKKDEYSKELEKHKKDMEIAKEKSQGKQPVSEDKKPSALVMKDRLGKENEANFKTDMADSNTEMIKTKQDELSAMEQVEDVPANPYELAEKIEKDHLEFTNGKAFKNMGDSTNEEGDEIPKRNLTNPEQKEVDMITKRQSDWVFDNKPSQRFEERMEKDMGEDIYKQRQEKMEYTAEAPMYNKDPQPTQQTEVEKDQFDKQASTWNERDGVKPNKLKKIGDLMRESKAMITGKYRDGFGKVSFVNFKLNETVEVEKAEGIKLNLDGMGNTYTTKVNENAEMRDMMNAFEFYINGDQVNRVKTGRQIMSESVEKESKPINEQAEKMKRLMGYNPSKHISTDAVKKNRNF